ncbi:hypothetical protein BJ878DRAFT_396447, partial [Calycina marina]
MPWLSRSSFQERSMGSSTMAVMDKMSAHVDCSVRFLPSMMDVSCGTHPMIQRQSTIAVMMMDMRNMMSNMPRCMPEMMRSMFMTKGRLTISNLNAVNCMETSLHIMIGILQICIIAMMVPAMMMLSGITMVPLVMLFCMVCFALCIPLNGTRKPMMHCEFCREVMIAMAEESFFYINGSMTSARRMQHHLNRLSRSFPRPITGIHNRTNGPILDMMMPTVMSMLGMQNPCSQSLYTQLHSALISPSCHKVVVISHCTGAAML